MSAEEDAESEDGEIVDLDVVNDFLATDYVGQKCWRFTKYLGSMLVLDFGGRIRSLRRGEPGSPDPRCVDLGTGILNITYPYWEILNRDEIVVTSDNVDATFLEELDRIFIGNTFSRMDVEGDFIRLAFGHDVCIEIDLTDAVSWDDPSWAAIELRCGDETLFEMNTFGGWRALIPTA